MNQALDQNISFRMLFRFALPTIASNIFMSIYTAVDGMFVSRLVGQDTLSAVNIVMPMILFSMAIGTMIGSGGTALVAKKLGEGKDREAKENFTLLAVTATILSVVLCAIGLAALNPLLRVLGADDSLMAYCRSYAIPSLIMMPFTIFGMIFQMAFITVGKAHWGLITSVAGGVSNMVLDYLFIGVFHWGVVGAAIATGIGYSIPSIIGLIYFATQRKDSLYFVKPKMDIHVITKSCSNGASEMVSTLANSVVMIVFNNILMRLAGSQGVAAITIIMYAQSILSAAYTGYAFGVSPIISFNFGKQDQARLKKIFFISLKTILAVGVSVFILGWIFTGPLIGIFVQNGTEVYQMAHHGYRIYSICFLLVGTNVFASAMFTALSDGKVSAILSFFRTLVFEVAAVMLIPLILELDGVWLSMPVAEACSLCLSIYFFKRKKDVYHYM